MNFLLRIVEGPNKGAEIALVEGVAVTLGKTDDCDIILADSTLPSEPVKLEATSGGVLLDGEAVEPFHVKTIGSTSFATGPADAKWGALVWPKPEVPEEPAPSAEASAEPARPPEAERKEPESPAKPSSGRGRRAIGCLVALLVAILLCSLFGYMHREKVREVHSRLMERFRGGDAAEAQTSGEQDMSPVSRLSEIAGRYGLEFSADGPRASLSGNMATRADRLRATAEAYEVLPEVELDLSDDESFRSSAEDAVFTLTEGLLKVSSATNRVISLAGMAASPAWLERTLAALNEDMPKLRGADVSGVTFSAAAPSGEAADGTAQEGSAVAASARAKARAQATPPVCGILTTPYPCLVLRNGSRLLEGAPMGDSVIVKIEAESVTLTNATGRFTWKP